MNHKTGPKQDYFEYLENVLGIKSIIQDSKTGSLQNKKADLLFCVENYASYSAVEIDLLQKMITAVKLDPSRFKVCDLKEKNQFEMKACVLFLDEISPAKPEKYFIVQAQSPRVLLKHPEFKKVAWNELQKIVKFFS